MFEKVTSEEDTQAQDYEERQALLNEIAEEDAQAPEEAPAFSFDGTLEEADLEIPF